MKVRNYNAPSKTLRDLDRAVAKTIKWTEPTAFAHETAKRCSRLFLAGTDSDIIVNQVKEREKHIHTSKFMNKKEQERSQSKETNRTEGTKRKPKKKRNLYVGSGSTKFHQVGSTLTESTLEESRYFPNKIQSLIKEQNREALSYPSLHPSNPSSSFMSSLSSVSSFSSNPTRTCYQHQEYKDACSKCHSSASLYSSTVRSKRNKAEEHHVRSIQQEDKAMLLDATECTSLGVGLRTWHKKGETSSILSLSSSMKSIDERTKPQREGHTVHKRERRAVGLDHHRQRAEEMGFV